MFREKRINFREEKFLENRFSFGTRIFRIDQGIFNDCFIVEKRINFLFERKSFWGISGFVQIERILKFFNDYFIVVRRRETIFCSGGKVFEESSGS